MSSITNNLTSATAAPATAVATTSQQDKLTSKDTFLKLLVAQIQNQDPTSPSDPTQFVSQLTQYSELEQLIQINSGISAIAGTGNSASSGASNAPNTTHP